MPDFTAHLIRTDPLSHLILLWGTWLDHQLLYPSLTLHISKAAHNQVSPKLKSKSRSLNHLSQVPHKRLRMISLEAPRWKIWLAIKSKRCCRTKRTSSYTSIANQVLTWMNSIKSVNFRPRSKMEWESSHIRLIWTSIMTNWLLIWKKETPRQLNKLRSKSKLIVSYWLINMMTSGIGNLIWSIISMESCLSKSLTFIKAHWSWSQQNNLWWIKAVTTIFMLSHMLLLICAMKLSAI